MTIAIIDQIQMIGVSRSITTQPRSGMMVTTPIRPGEEANAMVRKVSAKSALVAGSGIILVPTSHTTSDHSSRRWR